MDFSGGHFLLLLIVSAVSYFLARRYPNDEAKERDENPNQHFTFSMRSHLIKPKEDAAKAQLLGHVAWAFLLLGNYRESEKYDEQALGLNKCLFGNGHPDTLATMNNLGLVFDRQGKYDEAEKMHRQTLELNEKVLGKEHPQTLTTMTWLALVLQHVEKYEESGKWYELALILHEKVLGREHPSTIGVRLNLAAMVREKTSRIRPQPVR